uniref:(northern house mosquito) hypothetical protein n=2 Tax=Culex pipiens TaxID=7175 RepID=A0A8D8HJZ0_CULPI
MPLDQKINPTRPYSVRCLRSERSRLPTTFDCSETRTFWAVTPAVPSETLACRSRSPSSWVSTTCYRRSSPKSSACRKESRPAMSPAAAGSSRWTVCPAGCPSSPAFRPFSFTS